MTKMNFSIRAAAAGAGLSFLAAQNPVAAQQVDTTVSWEGTIICKGANLLHAAAILRSNSSNLPPYSIKVHAGLGFSGRTNDTATPPTKKSLITIATNGQIAGYVFSVIASGICVGKNSLPADFKVKYKIPRRGSFTANLFPVPQVP